MANPTTKGSRILLTRTPTNQTMTSITTSNRPRSPVCLTAVALVSSVAKPRTTKTTTPQPSIHQRIVRAILTTRRSAVYPQIVCSPSNRQIHSSLARPTLIYGMTVQYWPPRRSSGNPKRLGALHWPQPPISTSKGSRWSHQRSRISNSGGTPWEGLGWYLRTCNRTQLVRSSRCCMTRAQISKCGSRVPRLGKNEEHSQFTERALSVMEIWYRNLTKHPVKEDLVTRSHSQPLYYALRQKPII